jgi:hypothetical protein
MKFIKDLFTSSKNSSLHPPLQQGEREAIIDMLLMGIYFDDHLSLSESEEFKSLTDLIGWESDLDISVYVDNTILRVRNVRSSEEALTEFIRYIAERLNSAGSRERALELLNRLLRTDGKTDTENVFFKQVEAAFEISS